MVELDAAKGGQPVHRRGGVFADNDEIKVADGLLAASVASGGNDLLNRPATFHVGNDFLHKLIRLDPKDSLPGLGGDFQPLQDSRLGFLPEALEALNLVRLAGIAELLQRGDFQIVIELCGPLWPEAGHAENRQHALRDFAVQIFEHWQRAGLHEHGCLFGQVLADALDVHQRAVGIGHDVGHRFRQFRDCSGGVAIRAHAKGVRPLKLQEVGDLLESGGNFVV